MSKPKKTPLSLEAYMSFYQNPRIETLTVKSLREINEIHGYYKLHHAVKKVVFDEAQKLNLTSPFRSSVNWGGSDALFSTSASLTMEDMAIDLESLGWIDGPVHSVEAVEPVIMDRAIEISNRVKAVEEEEQRRERRGKRKMTEVMTPLSEVVELLDLVGSLLDCEENPKQKPNGRRKAQSPYGNDFAHI